ncbi:hypothetical protein SAMN06295974_3775 [Plantibacter flavus]|uniref:Uncharacterized protein n=1 Tax=Plantibacter flavus TaxID=150123 RepID=A0A3N2BLC2_9MICO|nr:hypothetical protein [Plantibacter flavus]ROR76077.1 hypothetical protein EDD42_4030 [Plantibacter flavus]SMG48870.1 hypothetical protein SAMN06295974_3775 [Plantibacter flavus]
MAPFTFFDPAVAAQAVNPSNLVVSTPPGRGALADLQSELVSRGSDYVIVSAWQDGDILALPRRDSGPVHVDPGLQGAKAIIFDDASRASASMAPLMHELVESRTILGQALPGLKTVILVHTRIDENEGRAAVAALVELPSEYKTVSISLHEEVTLPVADL